jgi:hypothetical protein
MPRTVVHPALVNPRFQLVYPWYQPVNMSVPPDHLYNELQQRVTQLEQDVQLWRSLCLKLCGMVERGTATLTSLACPVADANVVTGVVMLQNDFSYYCHRCRVPLSHDMVSAHCVSAGHTQRCQVATALSPKSLYTDDEAESFLKTCLPDNF